MLKEEEVGLGDTHDTHCKTDGKKAIACPLVSVLRALSLCLCLSR